MSCQDFPYFQKSKKILNSHWLRAVSIHLKSVSIWGLYRYSVDIWFLVSWLEDCYWPFFPEASTAKAPLGQRAILDAWSSLWLAEWDSRLHCLLTFGARLTESMFKALSITCTLSFLLSMVSVEIKLQWFHTFALRGNDFLTLQNSIFS